MFSRCSLNRALSESRKLRTYAIDTRGLASSNLRFQPSALRRSDDQTGSYAAFTDDFLAAMGWDGHRVVAVDSDAYAAAYDPARDEWATLPLVPVLSCVEGAKVHAGSVRPLVVEKCGVLAILGPGDTWTSVGNYPGHVTVTADAIYSVGPTGVYRLALPV